MQKKGAQSSLFYYLAYNFKGNYSVLIIVMLMFIGAYA